jgi:hypothetical protein
VRIGRERQWVCEVEVEELSRNGSPLWSSCHVMYMPQAYFALDIC